MCAAFVACAGTVATASALLRLAGCERADLDEEGDAVAHRAPIRGVQEREVLDRAQAQGRHLQDDAGQRRAQDFRLGETRA